MQHHNSGRLPVRHKSVMFAVSLSLTHMLNKDSLVWMSPSLLYPHHSLEAQAAVVRFKDNVHSLSFSHSFIPCVFFFQVCSCSCSPLPSTLSVPLQVSLSLFSKHCLFHIARIMSGEAKREETRLTIRRGTLTEGFK